MLCPILDTVAIKICRERNCPWWDDEKTCCAVKSIAKNLTRLQQAVHQIAGTLDTLASKED